MPILQAEPDIFPAELFAADPPPPEAEGRAWWVLHTKPRQEKSLARDLYRRQAPFYLPLVPRRNRIRGRVLTSHLPLFPGYVFLLASPEERVAALATSRVVRALPVADQLRLRRDLLEVNRLIASKEPITLENTLTPGDRVEIIAGPLLGLRGKVLRSASGCRFVVEVDFIQKGASVEVDESTLTRVED